ncbi:MAG TPA: hypothetical protein VFQ25_05625 [Ktedonobacterales bacterium]|nr:hypothetical protein [Ktedonobacterales bacterium]
MNRVASWILGTISGLLLAFGAMSFSLVGIGYGMSASCASTDGQPCTPIVQQATVMLPSLSGAAPLALTILMLAVLIGLPAWIATPILAERRGSSARTAILVVAVIATALLLVGAIVIPLTAQVFSAPEVCINGTGGSGGGPICFTGMPAFWVALLGVAWGPIAVALLIGAPAWVMTLTQTARWRQWRWFVAALLLSPVAALLYAFFGAGHPPAPAAPASPAAPAAPAPAV